MPAGGVPEKTGPTVGRLLQQARIDAGLTVEEISQTTRVRVPIVHAIEQDDFSRCGGDVYTRGHIRTLATAAGIDPGPLLQQYADAHGGQLAPTPAATLFEAERIRPERQRPNWTAAMVAAIVAVIGFVGFTAFSGGEERSADRAVAGEATSAAPEKPKGAGKPADPEPDPSGSAVAAVPADKVTVKVVATEGKGWVSAKDHNGMQLFDGLIDQGRSQTFTDPQRVDLVLGNAGAMQLFVNGKEIKDKFRQGQVARLTYTKGDPEVG